MIRPLTSREIEVLEYISHGFTDKEIADLLFLSLHTIRDHRYNLKEKLDGRNAANMIRKAWELGYLKMTGS